MFKCCRGRDGEERVLLRVISCPGLKYLQAHHTYYPTTIPYPAFNMMEVSRYAIKPEALCIYLVISL
jgi:hypothetical protein